MESSIRVTSGAHLACGLLLTYYDLMIVSFWLVASVPRLIFPLLCYFKL